MGKATSLALGVAVMMALTMGLVSSALAGTGVNGVFNLGKTNTVNAITRLVGSASGPGLQIDNNSRGAGARALDLRVEAGKPPMTVNSGKKVANLNSDRLDDKSANQLVRVASFTGVSTLPSGTNGTVAKTKITAPSSGFLVIDAGSDLFNTSESDIVVCSIEVDDSRVAGSNRFMDLNGSAGVNREEDCSTNAVVPVSAGTHTVDLEALQVNEPSTKWGETALSAIYIPFGGTGASPSSAAVARERPTRGVEGEAPLKVHAE
jgi:hypothetical protein